VPVNRIGLNITGMIFCCGDKSSKRVNPTKPCRGGSWPDGGGVNAFLKDCPIPLRAGDKRVNMFKIGPISG